MKDSGTQGDCSVTSVHCGLPSTCSHVQMSLSIPWEPHSLWKQFSAPPNAARDICDNIKGLQRLGFICFLVMPHYYLSFPPTKDSDLEAHGMFQPQWFDNECIFQGEKKKTSHDK